MKIGNCVNSPSNYRAVVKVVMIFYLDMKLPACCELVGSILTFSIACFIIWPKGLLKYVLLKKIENFIILNYFIKKSGTFIRYATK